MTKSQEDYLNMLLTTSSVVDEYANDWTDNVPFTNLMKQMDENNDAITDNQAKQEMKSDGITDDKKKKRSRLELADTKVCGILCYMAAETGDGNLRSLTNYAPSAFGKMSEMKLIGVSNVIAGLAKDNKTAAAPYGLTDAILAEQSTSLTDFTKLLNAPRVAITASGEATEMVATLIDAQHTLIDERFDKAMILYMGTEFYRRVQKARIIVDSPTHHLAMTALFTDAEGKLLPDVKISIVNGDDKVLRKSTLLGNIRVQNLLAGDHVLIAEKPGYQTVELPFLVSEPDTTRLTVVMKVV